MDESQRYQAGLRTRRAVLGDAHVERALTQQDELDRDFQDFITRFAWGEIWSRPGLPLRERSLVTLALLAALNRGDEFRMHVAAALRNGVTPEEIKEVILHTSLYAGLPAANEAFRLAKLVLAEAVPPRAASKRRKRP